MSLLVLFRVEVICFFCPFAAVLLMVTKVTTIPLFQTDFWICISLFMKGQDNFSSRFKRALFLSFCEVDGRSKRDLSGIQPAHNTSIAIV